MKEFTHRIIARQGIHARPASCLVKAACRFQSSLSISVGEKCADLKRVFPVMALGAGMDDIITVRAQGPDEEEALAAVRAMIEELL